MNPGERPRSWFSIPPSADRRSGGIVDIDLFVRAVAVAFLATALLVQPALADEPELPSGLFDDPEEGFPLEPGMSEENEPPPLPDGLRIVDDIEATKRNRKLKEIVGLNGFFEFRGGVRVQEDPFSKRVSLGEYRIHLQVLKFLKKRYLIKLATDYVFDNAFNEFDRGSGTGYLDVREAFLSYTPIEAIDIKVGRQILTWGTGDLLFINDLFPKDAPSTILGRDVAYLKAPSDALKVSVFAKIFSLDFVYVPRFNPDRVVTGTRLSYFNPILMSRAGQNAVIEPLQPDIWFQEDEIHARLSKEVGRFELALYGYWGYWKTLSGIDMTTFRPIHPALHVYGASIRGPIGRGVFSMEGGYYDSRDDPDGIDPFRFNSQIRGLMAYEAQIPKIKDSTFSVQYYFEAMRQYDEFLATAFPPILDRIRHVTTLRLQKSWLNQNLQTNLFVFFSPSDMDSYIRFRAEYKLTDAWQLAGGANLLFGRDDFTFFGQFTDNSNIYSSLRRSF